MLDEHTKSPLSLLIKYEQESLAANRQIPDRAEAALRWRGVGYQVGDWRFVSSLDQIGDISEIGPVTRVPKSADWLSGIISVRGEIMGAVDLLNLLTQGASDTVGDQVLVARSGNQPVAIRVDKVHGLRGFDSHADARPANVLADELSKLCDSAFARGDENWALLDLDKIINSAAFQQIETT